MTGAEPPVLGPIVTVEEFQAFTDAEDLTQYRLDQAIGAIRDYCGWHIAPSFRQTLVVDGNGRRTLLLPSLHVTDVHLVSESGTILRIDDPTETEVGDVEWSQTGELVSGRPWTERKRAVLVDLTHGFPEIPDVVIGVVLDMVAQNLATQPDELPEKIGPFEWQGSQGGTALSGAARAALAKYVVGGRA